VTLQDLSDVAPDEPRLYKFHGDLDNPASLVFAGSQYTRRTADKGNSFNIRLQSDVIGKRLLFIGYSLQDENVRKLLLEIRSAFDGKLPKSYLVAFDSSVDRSLEREFGLTIVAPRDLYPAIHNNSEAFTRLLKNICDKTISYQTERGLEELFGAGKVYAIKIATKYEIGALSDIVIRGDFDNSIRAFIGILSNAHISADLEERTLQIFKDIVDLADPNRAEQLSQIKAVIFQLKLPVMRSIVAVAWFMAFLNRRAPVDGIFDDLVSLVCPVIPDEFMPGAAALAVSILTGRGEPITDGFRQLALWWFRGYEKCPGVTRENVESAIRVAWQGAPTEATIDYWKKFPAALPHKGFHEIMADLKSRFARRFRSPHGF
jgi:hypothetical protein